MASTYSNLKFELIGTGDQSGTWGTTTNTNLGTAIEQALVGMATISSGFTGSPLTLTLTLTDTNAAQNARALVLNLTQALGSAGTLNVPAIQKPYMIINATGQTVTVKVTGLTGVAVPTGTRAFLYNNGTDVGSFFNYAPSLTLGTDLAVADGGTGASDATTARTNLGLGTISTQAANNVSITGGSITGITDLAVADGGTGSSTAAGARTNLGSTTVGDSLFTLTNPSAITFIRINANNTVSALSAADFRTAIGAGTGAGSVTNVGTSGTVNGITLTGGPITSSGTVTLGGTLSGVNLSPGPTQQVTGTLPVGNGGTGATTLTGIIKGNGGSAFTAAVSGTDIKTVNCTSLLGPGNVPVGSVTSVATSGTVNCLTLTGGPITSTGTVTLGGGVNVSTITTGVLPVARGGTGLCTVGTSGNVLTSNGTAWVSQAAGGGANLQTFSASGTYTKPPAANFVFVELWGAGGGGGRGGAAGPPSSCVKAGAGGGGGAYIFRMFTAPQVGATVPVTIGAGGAGGGPTSSPTTTTQAASGASGGSTSFGSLAGAGGGGSSSGGNVCGGSGGGLCTGCPSPSGSLYTPNPSPGPQTVQRVAFFDGPFGSGSGVYAGGRGARGRDIRGDGNSGSISFYGGGGGGGGGGTNSFPGCCPSPFSSSAAGGAGAAGRRLGRSSGPLACWSGGGSGGPAINNVPAPTYPSTFGAAGAAVGGGGGGGGGMQRPPSPSNFGGTGGNGGNGYAIVYTW